MAKEPCDAVVQVMTTPSMKAKLRKLAKEQDTSLSKLGHDALAALYGEREDAK